MADNDGRQARAWLPKLHFSGVENPVVQVIEEKSGAVVYTVRVKGNQFQPPVFAPGRYTVKLGRDQPDEVSMGKMEAAEKAAAGQQTVNFNNPD